MPTCSESPSVTFIVPARNEQRFLRRCLDSIRAQNSDSPILVVDNGSTDATSEIATTHGARVIHLPPSNPSRARNAGVSQCDSAIVVFVDADCELPGGWLENGLKHLSVDGVVALGSMQAIPPGDAPWVERTWVQMIVPKMETDWSEVTWLPAFNLMLRKSDFDAIGGFDESLETCEDSDLSFRLATRGSLRRDTLFPVRHLGESQTLWQFFRREMWRSRGNWQSAWKRGSTLNERASLLIPLGYLTLCLAAILFAGLATMAGGLMYLFFFMAALGVVAVPMALSVIKFGRTGLWQRSLLLAMYLVARGLGPFWRADRVARS